MIFHDNLILENKNKIPSNDKNFFIFSKHWDFSQKITFDVDNVDIENLYIVLQSYLWNSDLRTLKIYTFKENKEEKNKILNYFNVFIVKKMNFFFFLIGEKMCQIMIENIYAKMIYMV